MASTQIINIILSLKLSVLPWHVCVLLKSVDSLSQFGNNQFAPINANCIFVSSRLRMFVFVFCHRKVDMADVKYSEWCRAEIGMAETDLASASADEAHGDLWIAK